MANYPPPLLPSDHTAPVPRRIRAVLNGHVVFDTNSALYVWEWPNYPQYYIPVGDIDATVLVDERHDEKLALGSARRYGLAVGSASRAAALWVFEEDAQHGLAEMGRFEWGALDAWYEEDEQVFVHPRDPYKRVDALRSTRHIRVELDGSVLAESDSPVLVFETGLPTRYYLNRSEVDFTHLVPTETVTSCPYKGTTALYWSADINRVCFPDLAWSYDFPTRQLLPIAGLVAFYNERVDIVLDGRQLDRPVTRYS